jgi:hypothetical protein
MVQWRTAQSTSWNWDVNAETTETNEFQIDIRPPVSGSCRPQHSSSRINLPESNTVTSMAGSPMGREDLPPAVESGQKSVERAGEMHQADGRTQ